MSIAMLVPALKSLIGISNVKATYEALINNQKDAIFLLFNYLYFKEILINLKWKKIFSFCLDDYLITQKDIFKG